jgi:hypothetical protein
VLRVTSHCLYAFPPLSLNSRGEIPVLLSVSTLRVCRPVFVLFGRDRKRGVNETLEKACGKVFNFFGETDDEPQFFKPGKEDSLVKTAKEQLENFFRQAGSEKTVFVFSHGVRVMHDFAFDLDDIFNREVSDDPAVFLRPIDVYEL